VFSLFLYPSLVLAGVVWSAVSLTLASVDVVVSGVLILQALYKYWDDKWKVSKFVVISLSLSAAIMFGFVLASVFVFDSTNAGGAAFGTLLYVGFAVAILVKWSSSGYWLPPRWSKFAGVTVAAFFIAGIVIGAVDLSKDKYLAGLLWVSCGYFTAVLSVFLVGISRMRFVCHCLLLPLSQVAQFYLLQDV
jgi:hypothetical protein